MKPLGYAFLHEVNCCHKFIMMFASIIFGIFLYNEIGMSFFFGRAINSKFQYFPKRWSSIPAPALSSFLGNLMVLRFCGKLWLITNIQSVKITVQLVQLKAEGQSKLTLTLMTSVEQVIQQFNNAFEMILVEEVMSLVIICIIFSFEIIMWAVSGKLTAVLFQTLEFCLGLCITFVIASTQLHTQVYTFLRLYAVHQFRLIFTQVKSKFVLPHVMLFWVTQGKKICL